MNRTASKYNHFFRPSIRFIKFPPNKEGISPLFAISNFIGEIVILISNLLSGILFSLCIYYLFFRNNRTAIALLIAFGSFMGLYVYCMDRFVFSKNN